MDTMYRTILAKIISLKYEKLNISFGRLKFLGGNTTLHSVVIFLTAPQKIIGLSKFIGWSGLV